MCQKLKRLWIYLSIIAGMIVCFVFFYILTFLFLDAPSDINVLGNWITVLIFLVTISAGVLPIVLTNRQSDFEDKIMGKFNNLRGDIVSQKRDLEHLSTNIEKEIENFYSLRNNYVHDMALFFALMLPIQIKAKEWSEVGWCIINATKLLLGCEDNYKKHIIILLQKTLADKKNDLEGLTIQENQRIAMHETLLSLKNNPDFDKIKQIYAVLGINI